MSGGIALKTPDAIWWDNVSGPSRLVSETVSSLREGKSVCLCADCRIPYRDSFLRQVANELRETDPSLLFEDTIETEEDPGGHIIDRFELRSGYRQTMRPAGYIQNSGALSDRLVPVTADGDTARKWYDFIGSYKSDSLKNGLFVLEAVGFTPKSVSKSICALKYSDFVSEYDSMLFAGLISNRTASGRGAERYITALAVSLLGTDAERIAGFVQDYKIDGDPIEYISGLDDTTLIRKVWNAQIQELFPFIMRETREFIDTWRAQIDETFEYIKASRLYSCSLFPNGLRNMVDEEICTPEEMELAAIYYLMRKKRRDKYGNETSEYVLYIPDENVRARMKLLYDSRNKIAHGKICDAGEVVKLLSSAEPAGL